MKKLTLLFILFLISISISAQQYYSFRDKNNVIIYTQVTHNGVYVSFIPEQGWLFYSLKSIDSEDYYYVNKRDFITITKDLKILFMGSLDNVANAWPFYAYNTNSSGSVNNDNKPQLCYTCHGTGRCAVCGGSGIYSAYGYSSACSACNGSGKCWHCYGSGKQ